MDFRIGAALAAISLCIALPVQGRDAILEGTRNQALESTPAAGQHASEAQTPAWQEPGFVMDEVTATAKVGEFESYEPEKVRVDLDALLQLHRGVFVPTE